MTDTVTVRGNATDLDSDDNTNGRPGTGRVPAPALVQRQLPRLRRDGQRAVPGTQLWTVGMAFFGPSPGDEMAVDDSAHLSRLYTADGPRTLRVQGRRRQHDRPDLDLQPAMETDIVGYTGIRAIKNND
ncbi:hypothetical protein [Streptomyces thermolilacinus]|uniref:Uncharacterized protein n=1 Tax=Streptomyces thermolilacinus SPC6 TaxID=1306406 RepID=A0A1D3DZG1_9ACTN|nr:hypothetical protein [Streptomyces thermolilacinus]OEJ97704.1 hypothetical protein J116_027900 [Streptomyces thermolilacinus SPC6]